MIDGEIVHKGRELYYQASYDEVWVDDSFSHEFGVCECGHWEIAGIEVEYLIDDEGCPVGLTDDLYAIICADVVEKYIQ